MTPAPAFVCKIDESQQEASESQFMSGAGVRTMAIGAYEIGRFFWEIRTKDRRYPSPVHWARELGCYVCYTCKQPSRKKRIPMDIDAMVISWHKIYVGLATAHDKDEADFYEGSVESLLTPLLTAPVKQIRQFADRLLEVLKTDKAVPFLVWRAFEVYVEQMRKAPDEGVKELKTALAREIVNMVEGDMKDQLPDAMVRALQWRDPERLAQVKEAIQEEKAAGRKVKMKGRESCLFMEVGGTDDKPNVRIQI